MSIPTDIDRLIVLGSTVTGLALLRAAAPLGLDLHLFDDKADIASHSRFGSKHLLLKSDEKTILASLTALLSGSHTALIADSDHWLRFLLSHWDTLTDTGCHILHGPKEAIEICLDKSRFLDWCNEHELPVPSSYTLKEDRLTLDGSPVYPLLLRPEFTVHGQNTGLPKAQEVSNKEELSLFLQRFADARVPVNVSQSLLRPRIRQFSIGIARHSGGDMRYLLAEKQRPTAAACAAGTYVSLITSASQEEQGILALARQAIEQLDYTGIAEVEILHDPETQQSFLIEINVRPWAQLPLSEKSGLHFLAFMVGQAPAVPEPLKRGHWVSFQDDLFHIFSRSMGQVRNGKLSLFQYLLTLFRVNCFVYWNLKDPAPWWHATRRWLGL